MQTGKSIQELAAEIQRQSEAKKDLIADTRTVALTHGADRLRIDGGDFAPQMFGVTKHAHRQIGDRVGIPAKYYDRMQEEAPELLASNVNHWFKENPEQRMIRTLDGNARAFLSNRYQRIDNIDVANVVFPIFSELAQENGLTVVSSQVTERKMYLKAVAPRIQGEVKVGDAVQAGVSISNSEIGQGAFVVTPLVYRLICLNGMTVPDGKLSKHHVGARADIGDAAYAWLSDETLAADDKALMLKARDIVKGALSQEMFDKILERMKATTEHKITGSPTAAVEVLGKTLGLTDGESSDVMRHLIEGGDLSQWGILNAVTATANTTENYDRASELEAFGGKVLDLPANQWQEIAQAA